MEKGMNLEDWTKRWTQLKNEGTFWGIRLAELELDMVSYQTDFNKKITLIFGDDAQKQYQRMVEERNELLEVEKKFKKLSGLYRKQDII